MIIAVEGADKAGKHTQVMKIVEYLNGRDIATETLDFPQYQSRYAMEIKNYLNGNTNINREKLMELFALDRRAKMPIVKQWLDMGKWVVFDRYTYSNIYSIAKLPREQWVPEIEKLEDMEFNQMGIIRPDHNIYLYLPAQISYEMRNQGLKAYQNGKPDINESDLNLLISVADVYKTLVARDAKNWTVVDEIKPDGTRMNPDEVFASLCPILDKMVLLNHTKQR